jgi:hypothetical protein
MHRLEMKVGIVILYSICMLSSNALAEFRPVEGVTLEDMLGGEKTKRILTTSPAIEVFRLGKNHPQTQPAKFATSETRDVFAVLTNVKKLWRAIRLLFSIPA